ncbi:plasmid pRiA4b ORF-3 family protein [Aromatoleum diolicum]|uniref:Plasmid pRiA4b ORF-3 family protein n=1 Tax=Aromatoleum diolicum TaxID=75796 RepID=A0ABX1QEK0_9RHOO|nr:plasmid pRiA4b ORF-3 family protein [Aromatoleum diolicum]NMG75927.1 plasmid pRiA4b ORF-3 family protein [Aromatoleum diolicum]
MTEKQTVPTYTLRIELEGIEPLVWRRLLVDGNISLSKLHHYIQAAMGWANAHRHEFEIGGKVFADPHPEDDLSRPVSDERRTRLSKLVKAADHFLYRYDFGDSWSHRVIVEAVSGDESEPKGYAYVAAGERACPPEDVGGTDQYAEFVEAITKRPGSEEAKDWLQWAGADFDPERFDRIATNAALLRMGWNRWV